MILLENTWLRAEIKLFGAELSRLFDKRDGTELLWDGDPAFWTGQSPVLFPIVGKLVNDAYSYEGKTYELPAHGFARRSKFEVIESTPEWAVFRLVSSEETLKSYPFPFSFDVTYRLFERSLTIGYQIQNSSNGTIYFSVGGHPAFRCPLLPGETMHDYYLQFEHSEKAKRLPLSGKLLSGEQEHYEITEGTLPLTPDLFKEDAIVLTELRSRMISLKSRKSPKTISLAFEGFPYLGIWSPIGGAPFVCLEPWCGIADTAGRSVPFPLKEGIVSLTAEAVFQREFSIRVG